MRIVIILTLALSATAQTLPFLDDKEISSLAHKDIRLGEEYRYEALNLVDGKRTAS